MAEMDNEHFIIACIRIPMKLFKNGKYEIKKELANIQFENCNELPEKGNLEECNLNSIFDKFCMVNTNIQHNILTSQQEEPEEQEEQEEPEEKHKEIPSMYVLNTELQEKKHYKNYKNSTFKKKRRDELNNFSKKSRK
jgi:trehalose-6-phosphate synthase